MSDNTDPFAAERERWRAMMLAHAGAMRMLREFVEHDTVGALPSEEALVAYGPEPHIEAEAVMAAIEARFQAAWREGRLAGLGLAAEVARTEPDFGKPAPLRWWWRMWRHPNLCMNVAVKATKIAIEKRIIGLTMTEPKP